MCGLIKSTFHSTFYFGCIPSFILVLISFWYINMSIYGDASGDHSYDAYLDRYFSVSTVTIANRFIFLNLACSQQETWESWK